MFKAFANIARIKELRVKIMITLSFLLVCRLGVFIPIPGLDLQMIADKLNDAEGGIAALLNMFSGGAMQRGSILALGIMPYISAAIIFQLLVAIVPALERIAREGESGRKRINQLTRYATLLLCVVQGYFMSGKLASGNMVLGDAGVGFFATAILSMAAGTFFLMWMGDQIDAFGIGNGTSLIIMINIMSRAPSALSQLANRATLTLGGEGASKDIGPGSIALLAALFIFMIVAVVLITQAQRRIPMKHNRRTAVGFSHKSYLPLKINMAGVIAIIFAQSVMMLPSWLATEHIPFLSKFMSFFVPFNFMYVIGYMVLIIFFSYFYTAIVFNPIEQANQFKQNGAFIPGIRPGRKTAQHLEKIMNRITLAGAIFIAFIAIAPSILSNNLNVEPGVAQFFGGTSLLIAVGVALDIVQRIESHLMMQQYEGFMKGGRIRGRR